MTEERRTKIFILILIIYLNDLNDVSGDELNPATDYMFSFTDVMDKLGWTYEVHDVVTEDKYVLQLFHLPGDKTRPVYLLSGNMGSADDYIQRGSTSLPGVLRDAGYDVWVGNWRGCRYGRRHETLDPDRDREFWDFSHHEFALYDVPAQIDHVLTATQAERIACVGWSLGSTVFYIMGAMRPEYANKVAVVISLAPMGFMHHSASLRAVAPVLSILEAISEEFKIYEWATYNSTIMKVYRFVCCSQELGYAICMKAMDNLLGPDTNLEPEFTPLVFGHWPSSSSSKSTLHQLQGLREHRIAQYDYGRSENRARYGSAVAPSYPLHKNNITNVFISGLNDMISALPDVEFLKKRLPNVAEHIILKPPEFSHFDFTYGKNSHKVLYRRHILGILKKSFA